MSRASEASRAWRLSQVTIRLARRAAIRAGAPKEQIKVLDNLNVYGVQSYGPCWCVFVPWNDEFDGLRSGRILLVSKLTGRLVYDGSACDEG
jgi:hypothetical protein